MPQQSVFAAELSWPDYDRRVRDGSTPILLPIGSMEQHGHHMPMNVDVLLPVEFARRVLPEELRPTFDETEKLCKGVRSEQAAAA